jgi:CPSF A subunit region
MSRKALPTTRAVHPCLLSVFDANQGAEYSTWAHITSRKDELPNLVTAHGSTIQIYTICSDTAKLDLRESFSHLAGTVVYLEALRSPTGADSLLIGFDGHPRLAVCSLQEPAPGVMASRSKLLLATSIIDLTASLIDASLGSVTSLEQDLIATLLDSEKGGQKSGAVILGGGVAVATVSFRLCANTWHASEPFLLPLSTLATSLKDHKSSLLSAIGPNAGSNVSYQQTIAHGFGDIWSACFLPGYQEPTLALLHSPGGQPWSGRLATSSTNCQVTAISVTVQHQRAAVLWTISVPADALFLKPLGSRGCLLMSVNSLLFIDNAGSLTRQGALAVNGWASATSPGIKLSPNPWPLPLLSIQLDGACIDIISERLAILVLRQGSVYLMQILDDYLSLLPVGYTIGSTGQISSLLLMPLPAELSSFNKFIPSKEMGVSIGLIFCGSRLGDSSLLGYSLEENVGLFDTYDGNENLVQNLMLKRENNEVLSADKSDNDLEMILQKEEDALYESDDGQSFTQGSQSFPDVIPQSDNDDDEEYGVRTSNSSNKRAKLSRLSILRSLSILDSLTSLGPLGPGCDGPVCGLYGKHLAASQTTIPGASFSKLRRSAKVLPCGYGTSGGLALVSVPGSDDRTILVEEDCLNVQSMFCCHNFVLLGMVNKDDTAGINVLRLDSMENSLEFRQMELSEWCKYDLSDTDMEETPGDAHFVFSKAYLLAAAALDPMIFSVIVCLPNLNDSYAFVVYKEDGGLLETLSNHTIATGFPSTLLQVSPFIDLGGKYVFGTVWSLGCSIIYTIDNDGVLDERYIDGTSNLTAYDDDSSDAFYQSDRITAIDIFKGLSTMFDHQSKDNADNTNDLHDALDDEDLELYGDLKQHFNDSAQGDRDERKHVTKSPFGIMKTFVAVSRQNGQLQVYSLDDLESPIWEVMGCGHGVRKLSPSINKAFRSPRMHMVYSREIRFFSAGAVNGVKENYFAVYTNTGDLNFYKAKDGEFIRVSLRLPSRPSKKQSEHHGKLRRKKILQPDAIDESIFNSKRFYHNELSRFDNISARCGLFAATSQPTWLISERRSLVALSHRCRHVAPAGGRARPVTSFCSGISFRDPLTPVFLTLHERIGRVGSQRLTIFKGISALSAPLGLMPGGGYCVEKIPMGVSVHRVQFIDDPHVSTPEHPLYAVLISRDVDADQSHLNDDGLSAEERQRIKDEKQDAKIKRQVEADLGGFDIEQEWVEEIEREDCFDINSSLGGAPPIRKCAYSLWIVDAANNWNVVDSYELGEFEHGLIMNVMYLTELSIELGNNISHEDDVGLDSLFVAVGTGVVDGDGEDVSSKGKIRLFRVTKDDDASALGQVAVLSVVYEKDILNGPVTTLSCLTVDGKSRLVLGAGADVNVEQWGMGKLTQVGFFRATMQILDIKLFKNFLILSDAYDSLYFLVWRESDKSLTLLAKDYEPIPVFAAGLMTRGTSMTFVCHDDRQNLQFFQYAPGDAAARGGNKLVCRADVHLGAQTTFMDNHFCRSSILINSSTPSSTLAALKSQDVLYGRADDDQRLGVNFGTSDGGVVTVIPLNEPDFWRLAALQSVMANAMESDCALNPRAWRLYRKTPRRGGCRSNDRRKGVIDGDLVIQYCDLSITDQEDLASAIGSTVELIIDNLIELRCASMIV